MSQTKNWTATCSKHAICVLCNRPKTASLLAPAFLSVAYNAPVEICYQVPELMLSARVGKFRHWNPEKYPQWATATVCPILGTATRRKSPPSSVRPTLSTEWHCRWVLDDISHCFVFVYREGRMDTFLGVWPVTFSGPLTVFSKVFSQNVSDLVILWYPPFMLLFESQKIMDLTCSKKKLQRDLTAVGVFSYSW